ncbi:hypothetical protein [Streptomyces sp. NPDC006463]|uniref:hypothetical protein n=1 Tax=Streptomyces sp. NPDC006463 TaxID=3364746 RepID=UPI0036C9CE40
MQARTKNPALVLPDSMTGTGNLFLEERLSPHLAERPVDAVVRAPTGTSRP